MSDRLLALKVFLRVARTGSFSRAAREQDLSQPTASRMVTMLEEELGVTLLARTTRAVTLTEAGAAYAERIQHVLDALDDADHSVRAPGELRGTLRVGVSSIFASRVLLPRLERFMADQPALRVELLIDDKRQNLLQEGADMVLRFGKLPDSSATARSIGRWPILIAAAPSYLGTHGTPTRPEDLATHRAILGGPLGSGWTFESEGRTITVAVDGHLAITSSEVAINAGVAGLGIVAASQPSLEEHLRRGELIRLLPSWDLGQLQAHALFPSGQAAKPAARAFTDFLVRELRG